MTPVSEAFPTTYELDRWLAIHHVSRSELWIRLFKVGSGRASVSWDDCVETALAWGWIDGQRRANDEISYLQRVTPRRPGSTWSMRNRAIAERLIAGDRMQPSGLVQVTDARRNGRWETAYAGSANMVIPADFLAAIAETPAAARAYAALDRNSL